MDQPTMQIKPVMSARMKRLIKLSRPMRRSECNLIQERIQARIKKFAWTNVPEEQTGFLNTLSQFFSPYSIVDGLTKGEARLLHLIAMHFQGRAMSGIYHPKEWRYAKGKRITREQFDIGLRKFMLGMIATGGLVSEKNALRYSNIDNMFSSRDLSALMRVNDGRTFWQFAEFIHLGLQH